MKFTIGGKHQNALAGVSAIWLLTAFNCVYADSLAALGENDKIAEKPVNPSGSAKAAVPASSFDSTIWMIASKDVQFGPIKTDDTYLEYEYSANVGPFMLYGYFDLPKFFGAGSANDAGVWDKGSPLFFEQKPKLSLNKAFEKDLSYGPVKDWYIAADWIYDNGSSRASRQNTLYLGAGVDVDTGTQWSFNPNIYLRRQWENYGAANENSWDGYRLQLNYGHPIASFSNDSKLDYYGFTNIDFGSKLAEKDGAGSRTDNSTVATNILVYGFTHFKTFAVARYFHNGGQWKDGATLNFGDGEFQSSSTGWAYYLGVGYSF